MTKPDKTTLDELMPLVRDAKTVREFGRIVLEHVPAKPRGTRQRLALAARDALGRPWTDGTVKNWLSPGSHTEARAKANREAIRKATIAYRAIPENREANRKACALWRAVPENAERQRQNTAAWREGNPKAVREAKLRFYQENPDYQNDYKSRRYTEDPAYRVAHVARQRVRDALKAALDGRVVKSANTLDLLGCSAEEYRLHLEGLWEPGMTWDNYGTEWEVDHIRPVASFDLTTEEGQRGAFHWSNTQPLWASENRTKGSRWRGERHRHG